MSDPEINRLQAFSEDFSKLLKLHGFQSFCPIDMDKHEQFQSHVWGLLPNREDMLVIGLSHTQACPHCKAKECEHDD